MRTFGDWALIIVIILVVSSLLIAFVISACEAYKVLGNQLSDFRIWIVIWLSLSFPLVAFIVICFPEATARFVNDILGDNDGKRANSHK